MEPSLDNNFLESGQQDDSSKPIKRTRNRLIVSCTECNRKKQKCNREWPCNRCLARRSGHLCHYDSGKLSKAQKAVSNASSPTFQDSRPSPEVPGSSKTDSNGEGSEEIMVHGPNESVLGKMFIEGASESSILSRKLKIDPRRSREEVLKLFPERQVVDFFVRFYLAECNWLFEHLHAETFVQRYNIWWSQRNYQSDDDIQFGVYILRVCVFSLQFLPHPNYPTTDVFSTTLDDIEDFCNSSAQTLDGYQPRKSSFLRIEQLLLYISILINAGRAKDSWAALGELVREGHEVDLFLEEKWVGLTEFEKEARRRVFWNIHVWDRLYRTFLGRWPLIPDQYFTVKDPSESQYRISDDPDAPTKFTDVLVNIKISRYMQSFMSAPGKKAERLDPVAVATYAQKLKEDVIDTLPPAFRLENPDTRWDEIIPSLPRKRAIAHIILYGVIEGMHKCFVGPLSSYGTSSASSLPDWDENEARVAQSHRVTLANTCIELIKVVLHLQELIGGGGHRYFFLPMVTTEASCMLGFCLISDNLISKQKHRSKTGGYTPFAPELRQRCFDTFETALKLLEVLATRSPLAQKGLGVLRRLRSRIMVDEGKSHAVPCQSTTPYDPVKSQAAESRHVDTGPSIFSPESPTTWSPAISKPSFDADFTIAEWESFSTVTDFTWFFADGSTFTAAGSPDFGGTFVGGNT